MFSNRIIQATKHSWLYCHQEIYLNRRKQHCCLIEMSLYQNILRPKSFYLKLQTFSLLPAQRTRPNALPRVPCRFETCEKFYRIHFILDSGVRRRGTFGAGPPSYIRRFGPHFSGSLARGYLAQGRRSDLTCSDCFYRVDRCVTCMDPRPAKCSD